MKERKRNRKKGRNKNKDNRKNEGNERGRKGGKASRDIEVVTLNPRWSDLPNSYT